MNDMLTPFAIPEQFDSENPSLTEGPFVNILEDFHKIPDEKVQRWQRYLKMHAAPVELESASWTAEIMQKSMTTELKTLVNDDLEELDIIDKCAHYVPISAKDEWNFDELMQKIWDYLDLIRIYTKPKG